MRLRAGFPLLLLALSACNPPEDSHTQAIIGAVLIDGAGGPPLTSSVVVVADGRIRDAGRQGEVPVSGAANKIDGSGRYIVPGFVDVEAPADASVRFAAPGPANAEEARARLAAFHQKPAAIHVWPDNMQPPAVEALLEGARGDGIAIVGHPATEAEAESLVQNGATVLIGMVHDADLDPDFVVRLRDRRIVYAPELKKVPEADLDRANRNTVRLFAAGVPLAVTSGGGDFVAECELLANAGVPPLDIIVAATANGARALRQSADRGSIQPGKRANLLLLRANPGEDIRNLRLIDRRMVDGEWAR